MRLTKFNPETGQYEYKEKAKTFSEYKAQRKAVIQRLGMLEEMSSYKSDDGELYWCEKCGQPIPVYDKEYGSGYESLYEAIRTIVFYNGHSEWLEELIQALEEKKKEKYSNYPNPLPTSEWHTEKHMIWMLLVGMFGDWGTSIRSGWIEQHDECIAFIKSIMPEEEKNDEQR